LLDLEGIRRYRKLNRRRQMKNLVQLNRTLGKYLRATDKLRFLESYLGPSFSNRIGKRDWVASVLRQSHRLDRRRNIKVSSLAMAGNAAGQSLALENLLSCGHMGFINFREKTKRGCGFMCLK